jgi:hypothetical protein
MRDEVEEFLKRVAQMRAQAEAQARGQQQRPAARPAAPPPRQPSRLVPAPQTIDVMQPAEAEVIDAELADSGDRVARHVAQHLRGREEIAEHTRRLGEEVDLADDKLEARLHQVFDHQVGRLKMSATDAPAAAASDAVRSGFTSDSIVRMLLSPDNIRNAIILGEILRRPED